MNDAAYILYGLDDPKDIPSPALRSLAETVLPQTIDSFMVATPCSRTLGFGIVFWEGEHTVLAIDHDGTPDYWTLTTPSDHWTGDDPLDDAIRDWLVAYEVGFPDNIDAETPAGSKEHTT